MPKGLIPVKGMPMVERQIIQLKEKGIHDIVIVVGHLKEQFNYLADKYGVSFIFNSEFDKKNNLSSLYCAREHLKNTYICSSDNWMEQNIFSAQESNSWCACIYKSGPTLEWCVETDENGRMSNVAVGGGSDAWVIMGPIYVSAAFSRKLAPRLEEYFRRPGTEGYFWEYVFFDDLKYFDMYINKQRDDVVYEFDNVEELALFDPAYRE
jgi:CTP:phosphocholine cytidylyltransferase-like protein